MKIKTAVKRFKQGFNGHLSAEAFSRVHKSFIVTVHEIPIGRNFKDDLERALTWR